MIINNKTKLIALTTVLFLLFQTVSAEECHDTSTKSKKVLKTKAAGCAPATANTELDINNVRARINTGGDMWWDLQSISEYEIPKGSKKTAMFSASLWMAGLDINGQLKCAAQKFRGFGNDFWTGPLTNDGAATIDAETCDKYDRFFSITRGDVKEFIAAKENPSEYPGYSIPESILEWPAHGDRSKNQSYYLAPFFDADGDNYYDPTAGDYPYYDFKNELCKTSATTLEGNGILVDQVLKGDQTLWWVFNDKGNIHTETGGESIGMEIRAQAFGFATNDEINNMTFYTYELINRSTIELSETYFSQWVDTDLGDARDDYVGCDVMRGLGYCYNGKAVDGTGRFDHYGDQPPAVGVDFFQGPYMDPDYRDNPKYVDESDCIDLINSQYELDQMAINGVNFGDGIVDNERFGMRRFVYHNNGGPVTERGPNKAIEYYQLLRGIWADGIRMEYGGKGHPSNGSYGPACDFMFPDQTDVCNWGTGGLPPNGERKWTEETSGTSPGDRRFMQSAGPFNLMSGAVNYITVGIPWARATSGGPFASVEKLRNIDDKCQALFDNCFKVLDGPDAPDLVIQELDKELILYLTNPKTSNNVADGYFEKDVTIPEYYVRISEEYNAVGTDTNLYEKVLSYDTITYDQNYTFEGYQIYQVKDADVSVAELMDVDKARLVFQCDVKNDIDRIINFEYSEDIDASTPVVKVDGENIGISRSIRIIQDEFAIGDKKLVNNKQYYFIAIAYAHNEYMKYSQSPGTETPGEVGLEGQTKRFYAGRKNARGSSIETVTAIPHLTSSEYSGTVLSTSYGYEPQITKIEGQGNGGMVIDLTENTIKNIWNSKTGKTNKIIYENGKAPITVKIIDPLNVVEGDFTIKLYQKGISNSPLMDADSSKWVIIYTSNNGSEIDTSSFNISNINEELFLDYGFSVSIKQSYNEIKHPNIENITADEDTILNSILDFEILESDISYADSSMKWLFFLKDYDAVNELNWIKAGSREDSDSDDLYDNDDNNYEIGERKFWFDEEEKFETVLGGTFAPYIFTSSEKHGPAWKPAPKSIESINKNYYHNRLPRKKSLYDRYYKSLLPRMEFISSINLVFTDDTAKWTLCPVLEMGDDKITTEGGKVRFQLRGGYSLNKNGDIDTTNLFAKKGLGWFPGYAINIETGERMCMIFGEDSWYMSENGGDMLFNPTFSIYNNTNHPVIGGKHWLYILGHTPKTDMSIQITKDGTDYTYDNECPAYNGQESVKWIYDRLLLQETKDSWSVKDIYYDGGTQIDAQQAVGEYLKMMVFRAVNWVCLTRGFDLFWLDNEATVRIRVNKPFKQNYNTESDTSDVAINDNYPTFQFSTKGLQVDKTNAKAAKSALDLINVSPNPYYSYSTYETSQLDNRVRITNIPAECTISIFNLTGTLITQMKVDKSSVAERRDYKSGDTETVDARNSIDWNLKNNVGVPISAGVYLIHIKSEGIGERVIKWFGIMKPIDLNSF